MVLYLEATEDVGQGVGDGPWEATAEVNKLVGKEGDYSCRLSVLFFADFILLTSCEDIVAPEGVVRPPQLLRPG